MLFFYTHTGGIMNKILSYINCIAIVILATFFMNDKVNNLSHMNEMSKMANELPSTIPVVHIKTMTGAGSGVIIKCVQDKHGFYNVYILSAAHVFRYSIGKPKITIFYEDNKIQQYDAELIYKDYKADIAYLKISHLTHKLKTAKLANLSTYYDNMKPGQKVYAIGCSLGTKPTLKSGKLNWKDHVGFDRKLISTNAPIIYGDSGGGIFNERGELIGIIVQLRLAAGHPYEHMNFAIPLPIISEVLAKRGIKL